jgi:DNA-binding MarR family transcriptional regulator
MAENDQLNWRARQERKWTAGVLQGGYSVLPHSLFECAGRLGITASQQTVLFHLLDLSFEEPETREVAKAELADRINMDKRQVQRHLRKLEEKGLITSRFPKLRGRHAKIYMFEGLIRKLEVLARESRREKRFRDHRADEAMREIEKTQLF